MKSWSFLPVCILGFACNLVCPVSVIPSLILTVLKSPLCKSAVNCGVVKYFRSCYCVEEGVVMFGVGSCVFSFSDGANDSVSDTKRYGVIRDIWQHWPIKETQCPDFCIFEVQDLHVAMPPA
jgi:hypothetical protein